MDWNDEEFVDDVAGSVEEYEEQQHYTTTEGCSLTLLELLAIIFIGIPTAILFIVVLAVVMSP